MGVGSGLDAQLGFVNEATYGTRVAPTKFIEFNSESLTLEPTFLEPTGLRVGTLHKREGRVVVSRKSITGDITAELADRGMGLLWKHAVGSSVSAPTQIALTTAYRTDFVPDTTDFKRNPLPHDGRAACGQDARHGERPLEFRAVDNDRMVAHTRGAGGIHTLRSTVWVQDDQVVAVRPLG